MDRKDVVKFLLKKDTLMLIVFASLVILLSTNNNKKLSTSILLISLCFVASCNNINTTLLCTALFLLYLVDNRNTYEGFLREIVDGSVDAVEDVTGGAVQAVDNAGEGIVDGVEDLAGGVVSGVDSLFDGRPVRRGTRYTTQGKRRRNRNNDNTGKCDDDSCFLDNKYDRCSVDYDDIDNCSRNNKVEHCGNKSHHHHPHGGPSGHGGGHKKKKSLEQMVKTLKKNSKNLQEYWKSIETPSLGDKTLYKERIISKNMANVRDISKHIKHLSSLTSSINKSVTDSDLKPVVRQLVLINRDVDSLRQQFLWDKITNKVKRCSNNKSQHNCYPEKKLNNDEKKFNIYLNDMLNTSSYTSTLNSDVSNLMNKLSN